MSSRGFSRGGGRGGGGPRGGGAGRGGFRGGGRGGFQQRDMGPPDQVFEMGTFVHAVEDEMLCTATMPEKVPYFNAPIYLENKNQIGKVDEVLGPVNEVYFTVKMEQGMVASRFQTGDKVYIAGDKTLPIERFLPKPKAVGGVTSMSLTVITAIVHTNAHYPQNAVKERAELEEEQEEARGAVEHQEDAGSETEADEEASAVVSTHAEEAGVALVVVEGEVSPEEEADSEGAGEDSKLRLLTPVPKKACPDLCCINVLFAHVSYPVFESLQRRESTNPLW